MPDKEYYSWTEYNQDIKELVKQIKAKKLDFDNIYGLPRGGLVVAVSLSHALDKPLIFDVEKITSRTLLVDDIIETGGTLRRLVEKLKLTNPPIAMIYYNKEKATIRPTVYAREQTKWVIFPWETEQSSKYDQTI